MKMDDAIVEFGFDCKVRKLSEKTVANYQKQLRYIEKYLKDEFQITEVEAIKPYVVEPNTAVEALKIVKDVAQANNGDYVPAEGAVA